jgi:hypothetical protein
MSDAVSLRKTNSRNMFAKMYRKDQKNIISMLENEVKEIKEILENRELELRETKDLLLVSGQKIEKMDNLIKSYEYKEIKEKEFESKLLNSRKARLIKPAIYLTQLIISNNPISVNKKVKRLKLLLNSERAEFDQLERQYDEQKTELTRKLNNYSLEKKRLKNDIEILKEENKQRNNDSNTAELTEITQQSNIKKDSKYDCLVRKMIPRPENIREVLEIVKKRTRIKVTDEAMKKSKKCEFSNSMTAMEYLFWIEKRYINWCESGKSGEFNPRTGVDGPTIDYAKNDSKDRLWNYKDRKVIANKHMKIGVEWNQKKTLRIYFEIIDDELVVFYAGRHP